MTAPREPLLGCSGSDYLRPVALRLGIKQLGLDPADLLTLLAAVYGKVPQGQTFVAVFFEHFEEAAEYVAAGTWPGDS